MLSLAIPLTMTLVLWPFSFALAQSLTPPPVSAPSTTSANSTSSSHSSVTSSSSASVNASSITNVTITQSSTTSTASFPSLSGYSACVSNCLGLAVSADGCNSLVDIACFCTNTTQFVSSLFQCVEANCPTDLSNSETVAQQFCNNVPNVTLTFPTPSPSSTSSTKSSSPTAPPSSTIPSSTSSGPTTSTTSDSGASGKFDQIPMLGFTMTAGWILAAIGVALAR